jgi:HAE1 family hydrophobic/amphiphilic exporter-1
MAGFSERFIKKPVMTTIVMAAVLLMGFFSFRSLPVTDLPNVDFPIINVHASYSGASPEVVAQNLTTPLEKELAMISGIKNMYSQSGRGYVWINLFFELDRDLDEAAQDVQAALKRADPLLPLELDQRPSYQKVNPHEESIIYLALTSQTASLSEIYDCAHKRIEQRLARIEGVAKVQVHGSPYAVRIQLNPELMAARNLSFEAVKGAIAQVTHNAPLGVLDTPGRKFTLDIPSPIQNAAGFAHLKVAPEVRLQDIAEITDGLESDEIFHYLTKDSDSLAVILGIQKQNGANAVKISQEIHRLLPELQSEIPHSMELKLFFDKAEWIKEAIYDVEWSLVIAFALVVAVVYLSLGGLRETLVAATALPLSIIGTCIAMHYLHFNLDLLSLLALTLAMGFVIDDAIVVLENIVRHREQGLSPLQAALIGSKQIAFTVVSMTLSLIAVFIPLLLMKDVTGKLFKEFSITLAIAILISGVVSLSLTPMLCSRFLSDHKKKPPRIHHFLLAFYERTLDWSLKHRKTLLCSAVLSVGVTVFLFRSLSIQLFPEEDRGFIWSYVKVPGGISKSDTENYQQKLNHIFQNHPAVDNAIALNFKDYLMHLTCLTPAQQREPQVKVIADLQKQFDAIPGTQAFIQGIQLISIPMGSHASNRYQYVLRGPDIEEVRIGAEALKQELLNSQLFVNPDHDIKADDPKLEVVIDENRAEQLDLNRRDIQSLLQNAYAGGSIAKIEKESERYKVILELNPEFQKNTAALSKLHLTTPSGALVPLKSVASWKETVGHQHIQHIDLLPSAFISFDISKETEVSTAMDHLKILATETLPASVSGKLEGLGAMVDSTNKDTVVLLLLAVLAMYVVLGILYESFIHPFTILSSLPFACLGGVLTLLLFKEPLSLYSMVGFLLLIGIVKKNGIMMIDYAIELQTKETREPLSAIREACLTRFRPIMMTTFAAVMGALPIAIGIGAGAETRRGLGLVIVGGLLFSQFLTLYITPILFFYFEKLRGLKTTERKEIL